MKIRMRCNFVGNNGTTSEIVTLNAVKGAEENKGFAGEHPFAVLSVTIENREAQGKIHEGREFIVDIGPA